MYESLEAVDARQEQARADMILRFDTNKVPHHERIKPLEDLIAKQEDEREKVVRAMLEAFQMGKFIPALA